MTANVRYWPSVLNDHARNPVPATSMPMPAAKATAPSWLVRTTLC